MSGKRKRKRPRQGYRSTPAPAPARSAERERRPGLLGGLFTPPIPASMSTMPSFRRSLGRGFLLVGSNPILIAIPFAWVFVTWVAFLLFGYVGAPNTPLGLAVSLPPLSVSSALQSSLIAFGQPVGIYALLPMLLLQALLLAVLAGLIVDGFETGTVTVDGLRRGIRAFPITLGAIILNLVVVMVLFPLGGGILGPGLGSLVSVLLPAAALWLLGFVPFVAATERRPLPAAIARSVAGGRTPGGRQFLFSLLYLLLLTSLQILTPGAAITANPSLLTWAFLLAVTVVHLGFTAALGYRWLVIEDAVPEPAAAASRRRR